MRRKAPDFEIAPVLEALGAVDVPRVRGDGHQKMVCPFHPDTSPSASVSQFGFRCFGCGISADAIKLLREQEGLDYRAALERAQELSDGVVRSSTAPNGWGGGPSLLD